MIVWVMPGIDFRQLQSFPGIFERAEGSFGYEPFAPTAPHEMEPHFEIRLAGRIEPRSKPAAADKIAIAAIEQRPILNTTGSLSLDGELLLKAVRHHTNCAWVLLYIGNGAARCCSRWNGRARTSIAASSRVDAAECAVEVQETKAGKNADRPAGEQMRFRIGIPSGFPIFEE
jgi:hypothetical protein